MESSSFDAAEWIMVDKKDTISDVDAAGNLRSRIPLTSVSAWTRLLGSVIGFAVPLYRSILRTEDAVEKASESTAEAVEKIAEVTEKIASDLADGLPDGGRFKKKALQMEQICQEVDKAAEKTEVFIHKVDHIKEEVDALAEPIIEKAEEIEKDIQEEETKGNPGEDQPKTS